MEKKEPLALGLPDGVLGACSKLLAAARWMLCDEAATSERADAMTVIIASTINNRDLDGVRPAL